MTIGTDEQQYLRVILTRLESVKPYEALTTSPSSAWDVQPGSALGGDDAKTKPYQVSHLAWQALTVASDHLHCLRLSLIGDQQGDEITVTMHPYAQATLLRAAFENGARAVWLLAPGKRLTRIQRRLALQADNNTHSDRMHHLLGQTPSRTTADRTKQIRDLAIGAGISASDVKKELVFGYKKMVRTAGDHLAGVGADQAEAVWSACSALAHGDIHSMGFLEREVLGMAGNVALTRLSTDSKILLWITTVTVQMIEYGFQLYKQRTTPPS
ncbi:hypothetical protein AB0E70_35280 [Streptomyces murinus]|uniref:hypothetical protein n=1 Tax=Streptomyces murinus TaxID=33900 RepID=UPI000A3AE69D|nr:hypothetical protein [Streptomyces murinus]